VTGAAPAAPPRGLMAIGAVGLGFEALVLLLAVPAVTTAQRGHVHAAGVIYLGVLVVLVIVAAARLRRRGGVAVATGVQVLVVAAGVVIWPMFVVGLVFAAIWAYWLHLRRSAA
jgi:hypothetical protein